MLKVQFIARTASGRDYVNYLEVDESILEVDGGAEMLQHELKDFIKDTNDEAREEESGIDQHLVEQKDQIYKMITTLAETNIALYDEDQVLAGEDKDVLYDKQIVYNTLIRKTLDLCKNLWVYLGYGYKHKELTDLYHRAMNAERATW